MHVASRGKKKKKKQNSKANKNPDSLLETLERKAVLLTH